MNDVYKIAAAHVAPIFLKKDPTIDKACTVIREAASHGARLCVFPEAYVPAFPIWNALQPPIDNHDLFVELAHNSVQIPGPELTTISKTAKECEIFVSMGFNEINPNSTGGIWNSNVLIGDDGALLSHHRKIVPTFYEKLTWAPGDGAGLRVSDTTLGKIGVLICGENTNPLARYTMMAQGEQVHISTYPPTWPSHDPATGSNYDLKHAIEIRAGAHSFEAKAFTIVVSGFLDTATKSILSNRDRESGRILDESPNGISTVIGPDGFPICEELQESEGILYAEIDLSLCILPKQFHDVVGGYNRFDIFHLSVDRRRHHPVNFEENTPVDEVDRL